MIIAVNWICRPATLTARKFLGHSTIKMTQPFTVCCSCAASEVRKYFCEANAAMAPVKKNLPLEPFGGNWRRGGL